MLRFRNEPRPGLSRNPLRVSGIGAIGATSQGHDDDAEISNRGRCARRGVRAAFSLVECLVMIGIIGLVASLILPAIQQSRENGRRTQCLNNLRQLGQACMSHDAAQHTFPWTTDGYNANINRRGSVSAHVNLLPYLEQAPVFEKFNVDELGINLPGSPPTSIWNPNLLTLMIPTFVCPSDDVPPGGNCYRANLGTVASPVGRWDPTAAPGAFQIWTAVRPAEFRDGLSKTVLFSEKLVGDRDPSLYTPYRDYFFVTAQIKTIAQAEAFCQTPQPGNPAHESYGGTTWIFGDFKHTWYNHINTPNSSRPDCANPNALIAGAHTARSWHIGGVNAVLADGSGRFVHQEVALAVWRALGTRSHGEAFADSL